MSKKLFTFLTTVLFSALAVAVTPVPSTADQCQGSQCQVTFSYTGAAQTWNVPQGATNIQFDVQGAAGGRGGGLGGRVTGHLIGSFTQLNIYVGGAGQTGALVNGGFNGGGKAGGSRTNEGSGGGASDIRLSSSLESRLVVAGGGGGTGGFSGGPGGHGGGEVATAGQSGQGGGGGAGTQTLGGGAGFNNGGSSVATSGSFGEGGIGGVSWNAGGGGGGGGWYGGGGGGADEDDCCGDGGGGGGGSSYAAPSNTANVLHTSGFKSGHGVVVISYELSPQLIQFSGDQLNSSAAKFTLEYNFPVAGLETSDMVVVGEGCQVGLLQAVGNRQEVIVENCSGDPEILIPPGSFTIFGPEPATTLSATVVMDRTGPSAQFSHSVVSNSSLVMQITVSDAVNIPSTTSFAVIGCQTYSLSTSPALELSLENCPEGNTELKIAQGSFQDQFGNLSDTISHQIRFDYSAPILAWSTPVLSGNDPFDMALSLIGNEEFDLASEAIRLSGTAQSCSHSISRNNLGYLLEIQGCSSGEILLELAPNSAIDGAGFQAPATTLSRSVQLTRAIPAPIQSSGVVAIPEDPQPISSSEPAIPRVDSESESVIIDDGEPDAEEVQPAKQTPLASEFQDLAGREEIEVLEEPLSKPTQEASAKSEELVANPAAFQFEQAQPQNTSYWLAALVVIAVLSLGGVGALLLRLAENNRSRSVK